MGAAHTKTHTNGTETTKAAQGVTLHGFVSCPSWDRTRTLLIQSRTQPAGAGCRSPWPEPHGAAADRAESALAHTKTHTIGTGTALALAALLLALAGCEVSAHIESQAEPVKSIAPAFADSANRVVCYTAIYLAKPQFSCVALPRDTARAGGGR